MTTTAPSQGKRTSLDALLSPVLAYPGRLSRIAGVGILLYLCWRILLPFLPAICWAFALAILAEPVYRGILRRLKSPSLASFIAVLLVILIVILPTALLGRALYHEAAAFMRDAGKDQASIREKIESTAFFGHLIQWLDARFDLPGATADLLRSAAASISSMLSSLVAGSVRFFAQTGVTLFLLFYFLRDRESILGVLTRLIPAEGLIADAIFARIVNTIRISLGGKLVTATLQGVLGGAIFAWVGLPAPVFWGFVMGVLSLFPVIGAFLVWGPAAVLFASQGDWPRGLLLTGWGLLVIHPVDNLLGPILVGTTLRLHTLIMFFSIVGGIAAFGAAGIVLGPLVIAVAVSLFETAARDTAERP